MNSIKLSRVGSMQAIYEELDYLLVPTYFPLFVLLLRAEALLFVYEIARGMVLSTQISNAILATLVYLDYMIMSERKSFDVYVGGILPVALALVTNGVLVREYQITNEEQFGIIQTRHELWHIGIDVLWASSCLIALYITLLRSNDMAYSHVFTVSASLCLVLHVIVLDGVFSTSMHMLMCRIVLFYVLGLFVYSVRVKWQMNAVAHRYCTLHVSLPILFVQLYVLFVYMLMVCVMCLTCRRSACARVGEAKRSTMHNNPSVTSFVVESHEESKYTHEQKSPNENYNNNAQGSNKDLLQELQEAKAHLKTGNLLGFV